MTSVHTLHEIIVTVIDYRENIVNRLKQVELI